MLPKEERFCLHNLSADEIGRAASIPVRLSVFYMDDTRSGRERRDYRYVGSLTIVTAGGDCGEKRNTRLTRKIPLDRSTSFPTKMV
jgi:hypothetical protein